MREVVVRFRLDEVSEVLRCMGIVSNMIGVSPGEDPDAHERAIERFAAAIDGSTPPAADELTAEDKITEDDWWCYAAACQFIADGIGVDRDRLIRIAESNARALAKARDLKSRAGGGGHV